MALLVYLGKRYRQKGHKSRYLIKRTGAGFTKIVTLQFRDICVWYIFNSAKWQVPFTRLTFTQTIILSTLIYLGIFNFKALPHVQENTSDVRQNPVEPVRLSCAAACITPHCSDYRDGAKSFCWLVFADGAVCQS